MLTRAARVWLVESISFSRLLSALLFACLAFHAIPISIIAALYGIAMGSDLIDGYLARKLTASTYFGKIVDLVSDKSVTIVSLLYAAARGIDLFPLALIATRETIMIGARLVIVEGKQLFPTNKFLGGATAFVLWGNTLILVIAQKHPNIIRATNVVYWSCALFLGVNLIARVYTSRHRISASLRLDQSSLIHVGTDSTQVKSSKASQLDSDT